MEKEHPKEQEQSREEVLKTLTEAIETGREVAIVQTKPDGQPIENIALPISLQGDRLEIESDGFGFSIDVSTIKRVE